MPAPPISPRCPHRRPPPAAHVVLGATAALSVVPAGAVAQLGAGDAPVTAAAPPPAEPEPPGTTDPTTVDDAEPAASDAAALEGPAGDRDDEREHDGKQRK